MAKPGYKTITVSDEFFKQLTNHTKINQTSCTEMLNHILEEKEALERFASKITKVPESVRVYSIK